MKPMLLDKLTRLANSLYKTLFKKDKAKLKKFNKASIQASSEAELKRSIKQAINEVKGKDPRIDAVVKRFEERIKEVQVAKRKEKISKLPKFTSRPSGIKGNINKATGKRLPIGKRKVVPKKLTKDVTKSKEIELLRVKQQRIGNRLPKFTSRPSGIKGNVDKSGKRLPLGKRKSLIPKGPLGQSVQLKKLNVAKKEQKTKEFNKLKQDYKNTKDPVKKRTLMDKLKIAAGIIGLSAGAMAFLISDPKVKPTKIKQKTITNNKNNNNRRDNNTVKPNNNNNNNDQTSTIDAGKKRRDRLIAENKRAMELRKREKLKDKARTNAKKKRLQSNNKAKQSNKSLSKYDKYDYYDPSFLGIRSRLKKK